MGRLVLFCSSALLLLCTSVSAVAGGNAGNALAGALQGLSQALQDIADEKIREQQQQELLRQQMELQQQMLQEQFELERQRRESEQQAVEAQQRQEAAARAAQAALAARAADERRVHEARRLGVTGSGFFVSGSGHIVTNAHVVQDFAHVYVRDIHGKIYEADVLSRDPDTDLALLQVSADSTGLKVAPTKAVMKGQPILAIGYPLPGIQGQESKITDGIVNSLSGLRGSDRWFQISAPIQAGNSGGPLVNRMGEVVGVVVAQVDAAKLLQITGDIPQNVNYAIKPDLVLSFLRTNHVENIAGRGIPDAITNADRSTVFVAARDEVPADVGILPAPSLVARAGAAEQQVWQAALADSSPDGMRRFISSYPQSRHVLEAKRLLAAADEKAWHVAVASKSADGYRTFLSAFPESPHGSEAGAAITALDAKARSISDDDLAWADAERIDTNQAYADYLSGRGSLRHQAEARHAQAQLKERSRQEAAIDETAWSLATRTGDAQAYATYLSGGHGALHRSEAENALAAIELRAWTDAQGAGTSTAYAAFVHTYPAGKYAAEARNKAAAAARDEQEQRDWDAAAARDTRVDYQRYVDAYPSGRHVQLANQKLIARLVVVGQVTGVYDQYGYVVMKKNAQFDPRKEVFMTSAGPRFSGSAAKVSGESVSMVFPGAPLSAALVGLNIYQ